MSLNQRGNLRVVGGTEAGLDKPEQPETAREKAWKTGAERREKIKNFFASATEKVTQGLDKGVTYALGSPEAVAHAGGKAWDGMTAATGRFLNKVDAAAIRLDDTATRAIGTAKDKTVGLAKRAAAWGLNTFIAPIENKITDICNIPAGVREWRAERAAAKASAIEAAGASDAAAIERQIEDLRTHLEEVKRKAEEAKAEALARSSGLRARAVDSRAKNKNRRLVPQALGWLRPTQAAA